jgi:hypothetical protein
MNGAIEPDHASAICLEDSANDCQRSAHPGGESAAVAFGSLFSLIAFLVTPDIDMNAADQAAALFPNASV